MNVVDKIEHYQRSLERCNNNETKTLHCIDRLYKLPVTVQHLQETGVGRTVNALRKFDGSVGDAAKALVAKWKTMVVDEESSGEDEDEACVPDASEGYSDHSNSPKFQKDNGNDRHSSKHKSSDSREKQSRSSDKHDSSRHGTKHSSSSSSENSKPRENDLKTSKNGTDKRHSKSETKSSDASRSEKKSKSSKDSKHESSRYDSSKETSSSRGSSSTKSRIKSEDGRKDSSRVSSSSGSNNSGGTSKNHSNRHDSERKRKLDDSSSERETSKRRKSVESPTDDYYDDPDEVATQLLSRDSDDEPSKILPDTSIDTDSEDEKLIRAMKTIKHETPESPPSYERGGSDSRHSVKTEKSSKSKYRDSSSKSSSSSSEKSRRDNDKHEKSKSERSSVDHRKNEKRKDENSSPSKETSSKSKSHSGSSSSSKDHITNKDKDRESSRSKRESKSDSDSKDSKEKFKEPKEKKVKKKKINGDGGIDCNSGASFAEALGMCVDRPVARKKTTPVSPSSPIIKTIKTEPGTSSSPGSSSYSSRSSSKNTVKIKSEPQSSNESQPLSLLAPNVKLEPLNVDLASTLPEISPNYKPLPSHYMNPVHRKQEEANALSQVIYAKTQRTKVYSGNKAGYTTVPSLYDMCLRVLMENIDGLGFTGGIPYDILKPVLERATADQLFTLENYNPYLIEDTDPLWEFHCNKEFRKFKREEMDSWRDTYMRCRDEREVKLRNITANIKESIDKSVPVRSAKLAYVDNVVKPPRNVLRKQAKYGTAKSSSSDLKKKLILSGSSNSATNIAVPPPPPSARMKTSSSSAVVKKSKAPLMAKALQLIKGRYKR